MARRSGFVSTSGFTKCAPTARSTRGRLSDRCTTSSSPPRHHQTYAEHPLLQSPHMLLVSVLDHCTNECVCLQQYVQIPRKEFFLCVGVGLFTVGHRSTPFHVFKYSMCSCVCSPVCTSVYLSVRLSVFVCLFIGVSVCARLSVFVCDCVCVCSCVYAGAASGYSILCCAGWH